MAGMAAKKVLIWAFCMVLVSLWVVELPFGATRFDATFAAGNTVAAVRSPSIPHLRETMVAVSGLTLVRATNPD